MSHPSHLTDRDWRPAEVAKRLRVSRKTIQRWLDAGRFPNAYPLDPANPRSEMRIPDNDVIAIEQQREQS